ncbi:sulfide:quinone oxidoreductase [Nonomuraea polychroma]|uniref:Sulfide:quinone oxidoreductase n=1 Tax=Nonomuraea polychroma TaxID=46176 RepID=A0A438M2A7_9ACTN|nr:FAD/NAD(P)-binding oxidoreductase [Nonomuraea polychroma]RVX39771.1 sulfide:quinone oxidoreductase [Nonomuraea polychroma]
MPRNVVVLGAGVGGLIAASRLRELLPQSDRVVLVDRSFDGALGLSLLWVLRGWRTAESVKVRPTESALRGVEMLKAEVQAIDLDRRSVVVEGGELSYDALVIALGAALDTGSTPGLDAAIAAGVATEFYTLEGAGATHERARKLNHGRVAFLVAGVPFKCPAAPFEAALLAADMLRSRGIPDRIQIDAFTPDPLPMPVAGPEVGKALVGMLEQHNIGFHPNKMIDHIVPERRQLVFSDGSRETFEHLAVVPAHRPPAPVASSFGGWIPVDPHTLVSEADGVWAVGDVTLLKLPNGKPLPKAAVFAEGEAETVAIEVARFLGMEGPDSSFSGYGSCYIELGGHCAAKGEGRFFHEPAPEVTLYSPSPDFHREKVAQETDWLKRWNS